MVFVQNISFGYAVFISSANRKRKDQLGMTKAKFLISLHRNFELPRKSVFPYAKNKCKFPLKTQLEDGSGQRRAVFMHLCARCSVW